MMGQDYLRWILHEWDCKTLEEAIELAESDKALHSRLREAGIQLTPPSPEANKLLDRWNKNGSANSKSS